MKIDSQRLEMIIFEDMGSENLNNRIDSWLSDMNIVIYEILQSVTPASSLEDRLITISIWYKSKEV